MISLSIHPKEIYISKPTEIILRLTNRGSGTYTNLRLSFRLSKEILIIGGKSQLPRIESLEEGKHYDYPLHLKATQEGKFYLYSTNFSYLDPFGRCIRQSQLKNLIKVVPEPKDIQNSPFRDTSQEFLNKSLSTSETPANLEIQEKNEVSEMAKRTKIFISYSHKDRDWLQRIQTHLKVLENEGIAIEVWDDTKIKAGKKWEKEIQSALCNSKIALLLITTNFLASSFISKNELPPLLKAAENGGTKIIPLIVKPSRFERNKNLSQYQAINCPNRPLVNLSEGEQDVILVNLTNTIEDYLESQDK